MSIKTILKQYPEAGYWHQQYPWFSIGQLVNTANKKGGLDFAASAQKTAVFFNHIPRLHWLLYQPETNPEVLRSLVDNLPGTVADAPPDTAKNTAIQASENLITLSPKSRLIAPETATPAAEPTQQEIIPEKSFYPVLNPDEEQYPETEKENKEDTETELMDLQPVMLSESLAEAVEKFKAGTGNEEEALVYQTAYQHTIDYFASQGIRLDQEPAQDDQFGKQLKTFTSWLRQMKPLTGTALMQTDPLVESHAADSLQKGEVITEAMANVLLKQGKKQQAIQLLEKISLLHPEKSPYFAALIDKIKRS